MATAAAATGGTEDPYVENLNMQMICKECKLFPPNLVEEFSSGDMVCGDCGLVLGDRIVDTRSEWRTFANDDQGSDDPSRVGDGANPLLNGSQLSTTIAFGDTSGRSRDLQRAQNKSSHDKSTKNLLAAYKEIGAHCDAIHIPKTAADFAKHLFKIVEDAKAFKGKSQEAIIAGCIFIACRQSGVGRTFREIFALTKVSKKEIGRTFKALEKFFGSEENKAAMQQGGKFISVTELMTVHVLTVFSVKARPRMRTATSRPVLRTPSTSLPVSAPSWACTSRSTSRSRRDSRTSSRALEILQVVLLSLLLLPVFTLPPICLAMERVRGRLVAWLVCLMAPFARRISTFTRTARSLSRWIGSRARRQACPTCR